MSYSLLPRKKKMVTIGKVFDNRPDINYNKRQLSVGIRIEMEHTKSKILAKKIAKDHLDTYPTYYSNLVKMEHLLMKEKRHHF